MPHAEHRERRGRTTRRDSSTPRSHRERPHPHGISTPRHPGHFNSPATNRRSTSPASTSTVIKAPPGAPERPSRRRSQRQREGRLPIKTWSPCPSAPRKSTHLHRSHRHTQPEWHTPALNILNLSGNQQFSGWRHGGVPWCAPVLPAHASGKPVTMTGCRAGRLPWLYRPAQVLPVTSAWGVGLYSCRGQSSKTFVYEAVQQYTHHRERSDGGLLRRLGEYVGEFQQRLSFSADNTGVRGERC